MSSLIISAPFPQIALLTFNRPNAANALNATLAKEICLAFQQLDAKLRVIILTGEGERAFCAGADLKERQGMEESAWRIQHAAFEQALKAILDCPIPVIAAVNGAAYGGGLELALSCDFIYASEQARFALTEASLGIMPGLGGTQNLARAIGQRHALEMLYTGLPMNADEALAAGLVNRVLSGPQLLPEVLKTAKRIAQNAPLSIKSIKRAVKEGAHLPLAAALNVELSHYNTLLGTKDRQEGISAFNEKRQAIFSGK